MNKTLIAKPVIKNKFWIVTDGKEKIGNVIASGNGIEVIINGNVLQYKDTNTVSKDLEIEFIKVDKFTNKKEVVFNTYPTPKKIYNSVLDVRKKLHLFTKTPKSKCYHAAGWFILDANNSKTIEFCPKYIFIQRYKYQGPYLTKEQAEQELGSIEKNLDK